MSNQLRVAAFVRVSTDKQGNPDGSLKSQITLINNAVGSFGGNVVETYGGVEHGTEGYRHDEFNRMVKDIDSGKFDAVWVAASTRWSRDTVASELAVRRLKKYRVRLFIGNSEVDLRSGPSQIGLTLATKVSETETSARLDASTYGRIRRAALGFVTSGLPPYGRYVPAVLEGTRKVWQSKPDGTAKWLIDNAAKRYVRKASGLYLRAGRSWKDVAIAMGDDENTIRRRVEAAGGTWMQRFHLRSHRVEDFSNMLFRERVTIEGEYALIKIPIPPLLDEDILEAVLAKASAHYADRQAPNKQPLGGYMKCGTCGRSITTHYHTHLKAVYLQHSGERLPECPISFGRYEPVERSVFGRIGEQLNNSELLEATVKDAVRDEMSDRPQLEARLKEATGEKSQLLSEHDSLFEKIKALNLFKNGAMKRRFENEANALDGQLQAISNEIEEIRAKLNTPDLPPDIAKRVDFILFCLRGFKKSNLWAGRNWPKSQRRALCRFFFGIPTRKRQEGAKPKVRTGIFLFLGVDKATNEKVLRWEARGLLPVLSDTIFLNGKIVKSFEKNDYSQGIDKEVLAELIRSLDFESFGFLRQIFNPSKQVSRRWSG